MIAIMVKISTVFAMIALGYVACKAKFVKAENQKYMIDVLLNVCIPCMLLCSITANEIQDGMLKQVLNMLLCSTIYFLAAAMISVVLVKVFQVKNPDDSGVYKMIFCSVNSGFLGFPVSQIAFGNEVLFFMVIHNIVSNIYLYSLCLWQLSKEKMNAKMIVRSMKSMINPCIGSAVLGMILLFAGISLPEYVESIIEPVGDATVPMAMIIVGMQLAEGNVLKCFTDRKLVVYCTVAMFVWPVAVLVFMKLVPVYITVKVTMVLAAALPSAATISSIAASEKCNYQLGAKGIIVTTLMSMFSIPAAIMMIHTFL